MMIMLSYGIDVYTDFLLLLFMERNQSCVVHQIFKFIFLFLLFYVECFKVDFFLFLLMFVVVIEW